MEQKLRKKVQEVLSTVTEKTAPNIYDTIQAENGYKTIEDMMIKMAINDSISLSGTIPHIENML